MTAFFGVHLVLTVVSLVLATAILAIGVRAVRHTPTPPRPRDDHGIRPVGTGVIP